MLTPQRDQAKAAVDQSAATLATLGPALEPLKQAAVVAAAKATELTAQLEAARADLARWQDETVFLGRYRELAGVVAAREAAAREAEAKVAEGQAKVAADEQARQMLVNERQAKEKEIAALTAAVAKAQEDHAALLQKVAAKQMEMTAAQASMDQLGKAVGALEAAAVSAKSAVDAAPADQELAGVHATLVKTVAAKAAQIKAIGESQAAMAAEKAAREKEAADMTARAEKLKADMPAVTARMQELDGMITKAATAVESSAAAVRSLEPPVAERQKEVDAAVGQLSALQGLPPGT
jgi:chromosome segregation ATPase